MRRFASPPGSTTCTELPGSALPSDVTDRSGSSSTVQVDSVAVPSADGLVMISGAMGSTHHVHVALGASEITRDVAITQSGAVPARIDFAPTPSQTASSSKPVLGAHVQATTSAVAAPTFDKEPPVLPPELKAGGVLTASDLTSACGW